MSRNGLTVTMVFLAESANYGEGVGNISTLKKMTREIMSSIHIYQGRHSDIT